MADRLFTGINGSFSLPLERRGLHELGRAKLKTNSMKTFFSEPDLPNSLSKNTVDSLIMLQEREKNHESVKNLMKEDHNMLTLKQLEDKRYL